LLVILAVALASAVPASAGTYAITDLGAPPGYEYGYGMAISAQGDVVSVALHAYEGENGNGILAYRSFLHRGSSVTEILTFPGDSVDVRGINDQGAVAGRLERLNGWSYPFVWRDGVTSVLDTPPGRTGAAFSINNAGQAVGVAEFPDDRFHAVLWEEDGSLMNLWTPDSYTAVATAINDAGYVVGWTQVQIATARAVLWRDGEVTVLPTEPNYLDAGAWDINEGGQVVGGAWPGGRGDAFVYHEGTLTALLDLGGTGACARAINNAGQAVGWSDIPDGSHRAVLWSNGLVVDLNAFVPMGAGWELISAQQINDAGQIVGTGWHDGALRGFLLTPVPEPSGLLLGLAAVVAAQRWRRVRG
jgi:probable HAF family extracellular repeat protein